MRVWITRSRPAAERTAKAVAARGHDPLIAPLLEIHPLPATVPPHTAVAFTSAHAVTALAGLTTERAARVFAVGDATARAAAEAGFGDVRSAAGDGRALAELIAAEAPGLLLWPKAMEPAFDLAAALSGHVEVTPLPIYASRPVARLVIPAFDAVLIHSPKAGEYLAKALTPDLAAGRLALAISPAAAAPVQALPWSEIHIADHPDEAHLLAPLGKAPPAV